MKNILLFAVIAITMAGCSKKAKNPPPAPTEITSDTVVQVESHNARNSLDYIGMYKGTLPCADCAGIETTIQLSEEFNYTLTQTYLGKKSKTVEKKGTFKWNDAGNAIILENIDDEPNQYFVGENMLTQLDLNGNLITGKLAKSYSLLKLPEAQAAKTDAPKAKVPDAGSQAAAKPARVPKSPITPAEAPGKIARDLFAATRWKLTELNGTPVKSETKRDFLIEFGAAKEFSAYAGCNSIGGKYDYNGTKIKMFNIVATRMACGHMETETRFIEVLETANNFLWNSKVLQLRRDGVTLAKFDSMQAKK